MNQIQDTIHISVTQSVATLPDGTTLDLSQVQAACALAFKLTGKAEFGEANSRISSITWLDKEPSVGLVPKEGSKERFGLSSLAQGLDEMGVWDEVEGFAVGDWQLEVSNNDTRLGYRDWVKSQIEQQLDDLDEDKWGASEWLPLR